MPTYEYACSSCQHEWEFEQSIKENPLTECPSCHRDTAKRQISRGAGFILKGGGWYADLYSSPKPSGSSGSSEGSYGSSGASTSGSGGAGSSTSSGSGSGSGGSSSTATTAAS